MRRSSSTVHLSCSFCGKSQRDVEKLIAGSNAYICGECVRRGVEIILDPTTEIGAAAKHREPQFLLGVAMTDAQTMQRISNVLSAALVAEGVPHYFELSGRGQATDAADASCTVRWPLLPPGNDHDDDGA